MSRSGSEGSPKRRSIPPFDEALTLGMAAVAYAALLAVATLDRSHPSVHSAARALAFAIPILTIASVVGRWSTRYSKLGVQLSFYFVTGYMALFGLVATLIAIYHILAYIALDAAIVYKQCAAVGVVAMLILGVVDLFIAARRRNTESPPHSAGSAPKTSS